MKIEIIGTRGWSYAGHEDLIRELGPRFVRDGHEFTIHAWATPGMANDGIRTDVIQNGVRRAFHRTTSGKFSAQLIIALKASWRAAVGDADLIYYAFIQNGIYSWIPRLFGKKIVSNVDGIMWKDPKWPWGFRQVFFVGGAYLTYMWSHETITDSVHMQELYRKKFHLNLGWIGYGCNSSKPERMSIQYRKQYPGGYYLIMSRITPHNLTDLLVEGFIASGSNRQLLIAGHEPDNEWFRSLKRRAEGRNIRFIGLVKDQDELTQIILNATAYLHGHSLGGINPALVRVVGCDIPALCVDTVYNREVVEYPNKRLQAILFQKDAQSIARAIQTFESDEKRFRHEAGDLGKTVRRVMSWDAIYEQYRDLFERAADVHPSRKTNT